MDCVSCRCRPDGGGDAQELSGLRQLHRAMALFLAVFIFAHFANHLTLLVGVDAHLVTQDVLRIVYRQGVVEFVLLTALMVQLVIGLRLAWRRGWPKLRWQKAQTVSGVVLALFLVQHVGAVFVTRFFFPAVDTNLYWAAAVVSRPLTAIYFVPYYLVGVTALFVHVGAIVALGRRDVRASWLIVGIGLAIALIIVSGLVGLLHPIELPPTYEAYLDGMGV